MGTFNMNIMYISLFLQKILASNVHQLQSLGLVILNTLCWAWTVHVVAGSNLCFDSTFPVKKFRSCILWDISHYVNPSPLPAPRL